MNSWLIATVAMCVSLATLAFQIWVYVKSVGRLTTESILTPHEIQLSNSLHLLIRNRGRVAITVSGLRFRREGQDDLHIMLTEHEVLQEWWKKVDQLTIRKTPRLELPPGGVDTMCLLAQPIAFGMNAKKWTGMPTSVELITGAGYADICLPDAFIDRVRALFLGARGEFPGAEIIEWQHANHSPQNNAVSAPAVEPGRRHT